MIDQRLYRKKNDKFYVPEGFTEFLSFEWQGLEANACIIRVL
jgi:hypothetical protein